MKKEILSRVKLQLQGGSVNVASVGMALGPYGIKLPQFCEEFNKRTQGKEDLVFRVEVTIYKDKSFDFIVKSPPTSMLLKRAAGIAKASGEPGIKTAGKIFRKQLVDIAKQKMDELNAYDIEQAVKIIEGTAKSMGIEVVESDG